VTASRRAGRLAAPGEQQGSGGRDGAVAAAAGAMRQLWLDAAAGARAAGRDPVMIPDVIWPQLANAALCAASPLLTPRCRHAPPPSAAPAPQGRQLAASIPVDQGDDEADVMRGQLAGALRDRDAVTAALEALLEQLTATPRLSACRAAIADAAELLDDLAHDDVSRPATAAHAA